MSNGSGRAHVFNAARMAYKYPLGPAVIATAASIAGVGVQTLGRHHLAAAAVLDVFVLVAGTAVWWVVRRGMAEMFLVKTTPLVFPWRGIGAGQAGILLGVLLALLGWNTPTRVLVPGAVVAVVLASAWWWARHVAVPQSTAALIRRREELDQRHGSVATRLDVAEVASAKALCLKARVLRPSLASGSRWARRRLSPTQLGVLIVKIGWGWWGQRVWSSCEDATGRIGGPRTGKTLSLACHGLDAPGALITTSTRLDLAEMVQTARAARGVVHVFNPAALGGIGSTVRWRVLAGCTDYTTAQRRAADLIPESHGDAERWDNAARRVLGILLHAAASSGRSMRDVVRWAGDNTPQTHAEVTDALIEGGDGARDRIAAMRLHWITNDRTRTSVTATMSTPLAWVSDDLARTLGDAPAGDPHLLDVPKLLATGGTLHLIGHESATSLSPLIGALVAEIAHAARTLAATQAGGRLDPPATFLLDEAALVCPVPLDKWTADMGGRGVTIHISVQSLAQLRQRWGKDGAGTILANIASFLVFGGSVAAEDLKDISLLTGEHRVGPGRGRGPPAGVPPVDPCPVPGTDPRPARGPGVAPAPWPAPGGRTRPQGHRTPSLEARPAPGRRHPRHREHRRTPHPGRRPRRGGGGTVRRSVPDPEALVAVLAGKVDALDQAHARTVTDVQDLARAFAHLNHQIRTLTSTLHENPSAGAGLRAGTTPPAGPTGPGAGEPDQDVAGQPDWINVSDPRAAVALLGEVQAFADEFLAPLGWAVPAPCWPLHPEVVTELLALSESHQHAWAEPTPTDVCEWLSRWLPGAGARITTALGPCLAERGHRHAGRTYRATGLRLEAIARWWATERTLPAPEAFTLQPLD